jgi:tRNA pseudouridine32 synthase/23S rRNA pseudouridine746 synthase
LRELGHPILGDDLYASEHEQQLADRLLLHALSLSIVHPTTNEQMTFMAECQF